MATTTALDVSVSTAEQIFNAFGSVGDDGARAALATLMYSSEPLTADFGLDNLGRLRTNVSEFLLTQAGFLLKSVLDQLLLDIIKSEPSLMYRDLAKKDARWQHPWRFEQPDYRITYAAFSNWWNSEGSWLWHKDARRVISKLDSDLKPRGGYVAAKDVSALVRDTMGYLPESVRTAVTSAYQAYSLYKPTQPQSKDSKAPAPETKAPETVPLTAGAVVGPDALADVAQLVEGILEQVSKTGKLSDLRVDALDWQSRHNAALALSDEHERNKALTVLSVDFVSVAQCYGRIILQELYKKEDRTLARRDVGGGDKFICYGIFFKLCRDTDIFKGRSQNPFWMYGAGNESAEYAAKAGGHEMRFAAQYGKYMTRAGDVRVCVPMYTLVDAFGFRLLALPFLPVSGTGAKPIWGSSDAGRTVRAEHEDFNTAMKEAAAAMHIAPMTIATEGRTINLYSVTDLEAHVGTDASD